MKVEFLLQIADGEESLRGFPGSSRDRPESLGEYTPEMSFAPLVNGTLVYKVEPFSSSEPPEFAHWIYGAVISDRVRRLIEEFAIPGVEFFPAQVSGERFGTVDGYWYMHIMHTIDIIDEGASRLQWQKPPVDYPGARPYWSSWEHLVLKRPAIDDHLFRIAWPNQPMPRNNTEVYISYDLAMHLKRNRASGFAAHTIDLRVCVGTHCERARRRVRSMAEAA